jgi:hypothetical protein
MIHPSLHDIGAARGNELGKLDQPSRDAGGPVEVELHDRHARSSQALDMGFRGKEADDDDLVGDAGRGGGKTRQHRLGTTASQTRRYVEDLARPRDHAHLSRHACSISTVHNGYCQLRLPSRCSRHARRTGSTRTNP